MFVKELSENVTKGLSLNLNPILRCTSDLLCLLSDSQRRRYLSHRLHV